jgi:lysozyme family protein
MALFETSYSITNQLEGGYANDKDDKGGETYRGIARKFHPKWPGWKIVDQVKSKLSEKSPLGRGAGVGSLNALLDADEKLQSLIKKFYYEEFWIPIKGDLIPDQRIANEVYEQSVHMGVKKGSKYLQRAINILNRNQRSYEDIEPDGKIGNQTLLALNAAIKANGIRRVLNMLNMFQAKHQVEWMERDPTQEKFIGVLDRVEIVWS